MQKAGTTALFEHLRAVPGLQLPAVKEIHFFDDDAIDWRRPDYHRYHEHFVEDGRLWGEATPITIYWPKSLERLRAYNPAAKVIVLFRDPIERAWSHWKMEFSKRKETMPFAWCIREGRARVAAGDGPVRGHNRVFSYVERGFYGSQAERLFALFPPHQRLLLTSEDLLEHADCVIRRVCAFLGVAPSTTTVLPRRERPAVEMAYPSHLAPDDVALLADIYGGEMERFSALTGLSVDGWTRWWRAER